MQISIDVARSAPTSDIDRDHVLTRPDRAAIVVWNGRGKMKSFGIRQNTTARGHDEHVNTMGQRDVSHPRRLGQTADPVQLDAKNFGQPIQRNPGCVLQCYKAFIHGNRRRVFRRNRGNIIQGLAGLFDHNVQVFDSVHHPQRLLPRPPSIDIIQNNLALATNALDVADARNISFDITPNFHRMGDVTTLTIAVDHCACIRCSCGPHGRCDRAWRS